MTRATAEAPPAALLRFEVGDLELVAHRNDGPADGPVFVLVHGIGVSSRYFGPLVPALAHHGTVWAVDLPGHGRSRRTGRDVSIREHAQVLGEFLRQAGLHRPTLVGHSMGSQVVAQLAVDEPEAVGPLVMMSPTMPPGERSFLSGAWRLLADSRRNPLRTNAVIVSDYLFRCGPVFFAKQTRHLFGDRPEERMPAVQAPVLVLTGHDDL
ncbi:MAG TPA: alpha/beta fold hydrolase, partial [Rhodoglobus sp.]|nr:alpha/beta fold hydrolase [Rhodoglobus sp.]